MTKREILEAIIENKITDELILYAKEELARLDSKRAIYDDMTKKIVDLLTNDLKSIGTILLELNDESASAAKVAARLNLLYKDGRIEKGTIKLSSENDKKIRTLVAYKKKEM